MDPSRTISYIDPDNDFLDEEVEIAINSTFEENFSRYCQVVSAYFAMQSIDVLTHPVERVISYIDD